MIINNARKRHAVELIDEFLNISGHYTTEDLEVDLVKNYKTLSLKELYVDEYVIEELLEYLANEYDIVIDEYDISKLKNIKKLAKLILKHI